MRFRWGFGAGPVAMAALLASVVSTPLSAQATGRIEGTVTDARTQQPLAAAAVTIQGTKLGTVTGDDGKYVLPNIEAGAHTIVVRRIGAGTGPRLRADPDDVGDGDRDDVALHQEQWHHGGLPHQDGSPPEASLRLSQFQQLPIAR